jgi:hypothetical protein
MKRTKQRISKTKYLFFEKINKIEKPLAKLNKGKMEKTQINKIRDKKGYITTSNNEIQRLVSLYIKNYFLINWKI